MDFYDKDNFIHDNRLATCGNKVLYTSMGIELGMYNTKEIDKLKVDADELVIDNSDVIETRRDTHITSLDSLDNMVAFIHLGVLNSDDFVKSDWYFNAYSKDMHTWKECAKDLIAVNGKHRNYWWQNGHYAVGKIANLVSPHIQYYARRKDNKFSAHLLVFFYLWLLTTLFKKNYKNGEKQTGVISQKNIAWLILTDLSSKKLIKLIDHKQNMQDYFGSEHPIVKVL